MKKINIFILLLVNIILILFQKNVEAEVKDGWVEQNGNLYYYINNTMAKGVQPIGTEKYYFGEYTGILKYGLIEAVNKDKYYADENGVLQKGMQTIGTEKYYFLDDNKMARGIQPIGTEKYYFGEYTGALKYGLIEAVNKDKYYADENGILQKGMQTIGKDKYYFLDDNKMAKGVQPIGTEKYYFGEYTGALKYGLIEAVNKDKYYADENGILQKGSKTIGTDKYYFLDDNKMAKGVQPIGTKKYYFGEYTGVLKYGLIEAVNKDKYYADENGVLQKGSKTIGKDKYYFLDDNKMARGVQPIGTKKYYFGEYTGALKYGLIEAVNKDKYYADENGVLQKGVQKIGKEKYYFGEYTYLLKYGLIEAVDKNKYYANKKGVLQKGVQKIDNVPYYFGEYTYVLKYGLNTAVNKNVYYSNEKGILQTGVQKIDNVPYYFGEYSYAMKHGWITEVNKNIHYANEKGVLQKGDLFIEKIWYRFNSNYILQTGWQTIDNKRYYYYLDGSHATGIVKIAGTRYHFNYDGVLLKENVKKYIDVSSWQDNINWDVLWQSGEIDGAILRVGWGTSISDECGIDSTFDYNIKAVQRLGIPYSIYIFGYAKIKSAAQKEARFVDKMVNKYNIPKHVDVWYDAELSYSRSTYETVIPEFVNSMKSLGYNNIGVYGSVSQLDTPKGNLNSEKIRRYSIWVAQYYKFCQYSGRYAGWQYTSSGTVPGINGNVDISIF